MDIDDLEVLHPRETKRGERARLTPRELKRVRNVLTYVKAALWLLAAWTLLLGLIYQSALGTPFLAAMAIVSATCVVGALTLNRAPVAWTGGLAVLQLAIYAYAKSSGAPIGRVHTLLTFGLLLAVPVIWDATRKLERLSPEERRNRLSGSYRRARRGGR